MQSTKGWGGDAVWQSSLAEAHLRAAPAHFRSGSPLSTADLAPRMATWYYRGTSLFLMSEVPL